MKRTFGAWKICYSAADCLLPFVSGVRAVFVTCQAVVAAVDWAVVLLAFQVASDADSPGVAWKRARA